MATDVTALKDLIDFLQSVAVDVKAAKADGVVDWRDLPKFVDLLPKAYSASKVLSAVPSELANVLHDPDEMKDLLAQTVTAVVELTQAMVLNVK